MKFLPGKLCLAIRKFLKSLGYTICSYTYNVHICAYMYFRSDSDVTDMVYLDNNKRTLDSLLKDYKTKKFSCKQPPLLEIETDHIIPDELHLLLQIADVLTDSLITTAILHDKRDT